VDLHHLFVVMQLQRREVGLRKLPAPGPEAQGHRRTEYRQALVQTDHVLLVHPQQRPVEQPGRVPDFRSKDHVGLDRRMQLAQRGFRQQVGAARALGQCVD